MKTHKWGDLAQKHFTPEEQAQIREAGTAEMERLGLGALRKARKQTQVALADELGINQASVSEMERNGDLLLSTLAKYVRALGGELEIHAVFPEATFSLSPPAGIFRDLGSGPVSADANDPSEARKLRRKVA